MRLYQSDKGVWRYEREHDGEIRWASLHTRDEKKARLAYERMRMTIEIPPVTPLPEATMRGALWQAFVTYAGSQWREVDRVTEKLVEHIIKELTEKGLVK